MPADDATTQPELSRLAARAAAAVREEDLVELTRNLVRIRSVWDPERGTNENDAALFVAERLRDRGLSPVVQEVEPGRPNVICDWSGSSFDPKRDRTLMFEGHTDVVTEGDADAWTHPPFEAFAAEGRVHGRGSADMKAGVAAALCALDAVRDVAPDLAGRIRLGIVVDEEAMMLGIKHFIAQGWADDVDGAIICEPEENELCLFQKGAMRVTVEIRGVMAHGAMPYAGVNPVRALGTFLERIAALEAAEQDRCGSHAYLGLPWITPTIVRAPVRGEAQHNVMPERAQLALDLRTVPGQNHDALLDALRSIATEIVADTPRLEIDVDLFESRPWTETPSDDPLVTALEAAYPLVFERPAPFGGVPGATDGTFLRATAGVPIVTVGPGDREIPHQVDEFVEISDIVASARLYAAAAIMYLGSVRS